MDMAQNNPGEAPLVSAFCDPTHLAEWGYNGRVINDVIEGIATFDTELPGAVPQGTLERTWADEKTKSLAQHINEAHAAGIEVYAFMQLMVLPKAVLAKEKDQTCNAHGMIDISMSRTQELLRAQLREIFQRLPELDGLVIRTGEVYLHDLPYHATGVRAATLTQGGSIISHGPESHKAILAILRDEVCVKLGRTIFYRTWDFGNRFHVNPKYYLSVTSEIEPHDNLIFSIKHQAGDFHRLTPFNPTIGIGKHRQIIEVQCQLEAYGKGAHPYYVGDGVINGWEEYAWLEKPGQPKGLRDVVNSPLFAGIWTWSRGGGWDGPYITSEFWPALNAYVIAKFGQNPSRTEADIFREYEQRIGLTGDDLTRFRELCILSAKAILRGQLTALNAKVELWWARDDTFSAPNLSDFVNKGLIDKALAEKHEAVQMWTQIETLANQIHFPDQTTSDFVTTSATYGRIKYSIVEQAWTIWFLGHAGDTTGTYDKPRLATAITTYDQLWADWKALKSTHPTCSTLPKDRAREDKPGMGAMVDKYRKMIA